MAQQKNHIGDTNKMVTAVEWLMDIFWGNEGMLTTKHLEQAKQMEAEDKKVEYRNGWDAAERSVAREIEKIHEYYRSRRV